MDRVTFLRSLGPAVARTSPREALRAGFGIFAGLALVGLLSLSPVASQMGLHLIAPFGASAVLLFAIPNSPLAQPWSVIVGNTVAAVIGIAVCMIVPDTTTRIALAVGLAVMATILCRAVHPPAGAIAMTLALTPEIHEDAGFMYAFTPVASLSVALVFLATVYARLTGRHYPFRQFEDPNSHGTRDPEPMERLGLSEEELTNILEKYRQSFNLGVEDLARLIGAAEIQASTHRNPLLTAGDIMSRNLVTVGPETTAAEIAELFRHHRFTSLPVVTPEGVFLGIIYQIDLISRAGEDAFRLKRGFNAAMKRLIDPDRNKPVYARDIMSVASPRAIETTPLTALLPLMAEGQVDAIPILHDRQIVGIATHTDLIAALARISLSEQADDEPRT